MKKLKKKSVSTLTTSELSQKAEFLKKLSAYSRSVSTRKPTKISYNTGKDSYTDGETIVISADAEKNENLSIGLTLHEASHIQMTDMDFAREMNKYDKSLTYFWRLFVQLGYSDKVLNINQFKKLDSSYNFYTWLYGYTFVFKTLSQLTFINDKTKNSKFLDKTYTALKNSKSRLPYTINSYCNPISENSDYGCFQSAQDFEYKFHDTVNEKVLNSLMLSYIMIFINSVYQEVNFAKQENHNIKMAQLESIRSARIFIETHCPSLINFSKTSAKENRSIPNSEFIAIVWLMSDLYRKLNMGIIDNVDYDLEFKNSKFYSNYTSEKNNINISTTENFNNGGFSNFIDIARMIYVSSRQYFFMNSAYNTNFEYIVKKLMVSPSLFRMLNIGDSDLDKNWFIKNDIYYAFDFNETKLSDMSDLFFDMIAMSYLFSHEDMIKNNSKKIDRNLYHHVYKQPKLKKGKVLFCENLVAYPSKLLMKEAIYYRDYKEVVVDESLYNDYYIDMSNATGEYDLMHVLFALRNNSCLLPGLSMTLIGIPFLYDTEDYGSIQISDMLKSYSHSYKSYYDIYIFQLMRYSSLNWNHNMYITNATLNFENSWGVIYHKLNNIIEDRRIDKYAIDNFIGYRDYYKKLYDNYFNEDLFNKYKENLINISSIDENVLISLVLWMHKLDDINDIRFGDDEIVRYIFDTIDYKNISRLKTSHDSYRISNMIFALIYSIWLNKNSIYDSLEPEEVESKQSEADTTEQNDSGESKRYEDVENSGSSQNSEYSSEENENSENNKTEDISSQKNTNNKNLTKEEKKKIKEELKEQKRKERENKKLEKQNQKEQKQLEKKEKEEKKNSLKEEKSKDAIKNINDKLIKKDMSNDALNRNKKISEADQDLIDLLMQCKIEKNIEKIDDKTINVINVFYPSVNLLKKANLYNDEKQSSKFDIHSQGILLGKQLLNKISFATSNHYKTRVRKNSGKINSRILSESTYNDNIFDNIYKSSFENTSFHLSIDGSGSMGGNKLWNSLKLATALAYLSKNVKGLRLEISIRIEDRYVMSLFYSRTWKDLVVGNFFIFNSDIHSLEHLKKMTKGLCAQGSTPEGLCFNKVFDRMKSDKCNNKYFINISDGAPMVFRIGTERLKNFTREAVIKMKRNQIGVISFYIEQEASFYFRDSYYDENIKDFEYMYGDCAITSNSMVARDISNKINKIINTQSKKLEKF